MPFVYMGHMTHTMLTHHTHHTLHTIPILPLLQQVVAELASRPLRLHPSHTLRPPR